MRDTKTAPASWAASLIDSKTHYCSSKIPTSSKIFYATITNVKISNAEIDKDWHEK